MARLLLNMAEPGYLRLYGTTVLELAARGHEVLLAYEKNKRAGDSTLPDRAPAAVRVVDPVPRHGGHSRRWLIELGCTVDYLRFLSSRGGTPYLRMRMEKYLPDRFSWLRRVAHCPAALVDTVVSVARTIERAVPPDAALVDYLRAVNPDAVVVTPLVLRGPGGAQQTQFVKAARRLGIPVAVAVASWDHLSSKGLMRVYPDLVLVWNDIQRDEAVEMHGVPNQRVVVTGAQPFDGWFGRQPTLSREAFLRRVGLPEGRPMILYAGSSRGISRPEIEVPFVRKWIAALRSSADPLLRSASVLVRPHYSTMDGWQPVDLSEQPAVSIWPRQRPSLPMTNEEADDYFHSMYHSAAVVGINTSAMIEASIVGRQVYTVQVPEFAETQQGTMHFHYLLSERGGCVESAPTLDGHVAQLTRALADPGYGRDVRLRFIERFVRPNGLGQPAVDHLAGAIERLADGGSHRRRAEPNWSGSVRERLSDAPPSYR